MVSNKELARRFASGATSGRTGHMFIEGDTIYSYGHHFPIARRSPQGFLFNSEGYSSTTGRHKSHVASAIGQDYTEVYGADLRNAQRQIERNTKEVFEFEQKARRARIERRRQQYQERVAYLRQQNTRLRPQNVWE